MSLAEVLDILQYSHSRYYRRTEQKQEPEVAALFRAAYAAGVDGFYIFRSSGEKDPTFSVKPAVYVAEAQTPEEARKIHQKLWNSGKAPFLIIVLPNELRVYTGFDYSHKDDGIGVIEPPVALDQGKILDRLGDFCAEAIDSGRIWLRRSQYLRPETRVDRRLLDNLNALGQFLREQMGLLSHVAHALIGKYVYIRYLRDRGILSDQWFEEQNIDSETVLGRMATVNGLRQLCMVLDIRFNGSIFPLDFNKDAPGDEHVRQVAAIFQGDEPLPGGSRQLSLPDFQVYDFAYIPIELLSSIYEQFLHVLSCTSYSQRICTDRHLMLKPFCRCTQRSDLMGIEMGAPHVMEAEKRMLSLTCCYTRTNGIFYEKSRRSILKVRSLLQCATSLRIPWVVWTYLSLSFQPRGENRTLTQAFV